MMLSALLLAATCGAWHGTATGHYLGQVESLGPKAIDTWIEDTEAGLAGRYVLHEETRDVPGTLEALGDEDCDVAVFRWTDVYGTGLTRLRFHPDAHCFEGNWGLEHPDPRLIWRACTRSSPTS